MSDLLSSASLLLTLVALLYSLWYQEIVNAIGIFVAPRAQDRGPNRKIARSAYLTKAIPLMAATVVLTIAFAPETVKIIARSLDHFRSRGFSAIGDYDPVSASLLLVNIGSAFFAAHLVWLVYKLRGTVQKLSAV